MRSQKIYCYMVKAMLLCVSCFLAHASYSQSIDSSTNNWVQSFNGISNKGLHLMSNSYASLQKSLEKQTQKALQRMQKKEARLQKKLQGIDSVKSKDLFAATKVKYEQLEKQLQSPQPLNNGIAQKIKSYVPGLDSMQTALKFLQQKNINLPVDKLQQLQALSSQLQQLQTKMQAAGQVQTFLQQREQQLKQQLSNLPVAKQLTGINQEAYYYQQRFNQYKATLNDKDKLKQQLLTAVASNATFQKFWQKHSFLSSIFPMPEVPSNDTTLASLGLQTRSQVGALIQQQTGKSLGSGSTPNASSDGGVSYLQGQVQQAKSMLDNLKSKVSQYGGGSGDIVMPDFNPNNQKTKTFLKRLEYGFNIQSEPTTNLLPATSDIALTLGYKFSDKITTGIGAAYKLGWGTPIKNIQFSSQGIGLRSYVDVKAKGSFWVTGGFEYNYMQAFAGIRDISNLDVWQKSALLGITKKYKIGNKTANMQLLYDFLAHSQVPQAQPIKFRVGYSF